MHFTACVVLLPFLLTDCRRDTYPDTALHYNSKVSVLMSCYAKQILKRPQVCNVQLYNKDLILLSRQLRICYAL